MKKKAPVIATIFLTVLYSHSALSWDNRELQGTWLSDCQATERDNRYLKFLLTIKGKEFFVKKIVYSDKACKKRRFAGKTISAIYEPADSGEFPKLFCPIKFQTKDRWSNGNPFDEVNQVQGDSDISIGIQDGNLKMNRKAYSSGMEFNYYYVFTKIK